MVKIFGPDLQVSKKLAEQVAAMLRLIPGTGDLRVQRVLGLPLLNLSLSLIHI